MRWSGNHREGCGQSDAYFWGRANHRQLANTQTSAFPTITATMGKHHWSYVSARGTLILIGWWNGHGRGMAETICAQ